MDKKYQIFISSTYKDLIEIRREVARSILRLTEIPAAMEDFGAVDTETLSYIKSVIDSCDYYVLIIAGRYGSADKSGVSYTEQEYDYALAQGKTILAFVKKDIESLPSKHVDTDTKTRKKLNQFRDKVAQGRLVEFWDHPQELYTSVVIALGNAFRTHPGVGWIRADSINQTQTIEIRRIEFENQQLRAEIEKFRNESSETDFDLEELMEIYPIICKWFIESRSRAAVIELSWLEIFKIFAPLVRRFVHIDRIRDKFSSLMVSQLTHGNPGIEMAALNASTHEDFETFFMGHDLIEIRSEGSFYLTRQGRKLLSACKEITNKLT